MITTAKTKEIVATFGKDPKDCGAIEVQVAIITERINNLSGHFASHKHDQTSKRGLMKLIGRRKAHLTFLQRTDQSRYLALIGKLGLRK